MYMTCSGTVENTKAGEAMVAQIQELGAKASCVFSTVYAEYEGDDETTKDLLVQMFEPLMTHGVVIQTRGNK